MKRMQSKMRRVWSIVLTVAMIVSMCGMPAVKAKADTSDKATIYIAFTNAYNPSRSYNGYPFDNPAAGYVSLTGATYEDVVFTWYKDSVDEANKLNGNPVDVGTYYVVAAVPDSDNVIGSSATSGAVTIAPMVVNDPTITLAQNSFEYDGNPKTPAVVSVWYQGHTIPESEYTVSYSNNTNVGTATVTITDKDGGNFSVNGSATFEITKLAEVAAAPTAIADLVYNGSAQNLINAGTATGGEMQYSTDGTNYSTAIPTGTNAKTYTVWYKVVGDENYIDTVPASIEVTIAPKSVTVTADNKSKTYGEPDSELTYTVTGLEGSDTLTGSLVRAEGENTGTYAITQGTLNNPNYEITFVNGTFTINKATPVSLETPEATAITYGDTLSSSVLDDSSWAWLDGTIVPDVHTDCIAYIEVDDINYDYTGINGYDSANHRVVRDIVVTINRATLTITAKSYAIKGGEALPAYEYTVAGLVGDDTLPVDVSLSCSATDSNTAGTYAITISGEVSDDPLASHYAINYVNGTLTISGKDTQEITADDVTLTYGETENIGATTNGDGTITYATTSDVISVAEDGMITALKAGTATVTIRAAETADYAEATKTITVTVNRKKIAVPAVDTSGYTYTGTAQTYGVTSTDDYTVEGGIQTNAGEYPVTITLNNENYEWDGTLGTYTFIINKTAVEVTAKSYSIKLGEVLPTYDYDVTGLVNSEILPIDVAISCTATDSNTAGTYAITVSGAANSTNYTFAYVNGTLTISNKEEQTITASDVTLTYGETGKKISATTNGDGAVTYTVTTGTDVISVADDGAITVLKVGTATVTICADETDDYAAAAKTISVTVNKAENAPNLPSAAMNVSYDTKTVGAVTLPTGWDWEAADVTKTLTTGESVTAIALYKGADAGNYENEIVEVAITRSACSHSGDTELKNASAATCTVAGYTGDLYCKDCGERISVGQSISAPGHDYNSEVTTEATTTREGVRTYTCEKCGDSYTQSIPKLPMPTNTPIPSPTATPSPVPTATPTSEPELTPEESPYIQGEDGKSGWDAIIDEIEVSMKNIVEDSEEKVVVTVDMNGTTKVPKDVFEQIAGKDISVEFVLGDGLMWNVNGKDADTKGLKDIDLAVTLESKENPLTSIPATIINAIAGERQSVKMQLAHSGEFGFEAVLTVGLEEKNAGMYANLFFFNPVTKALEFIFADVIAADGKAELSFTHASDYLVVLSEESMEPVQEEPLVPEEDKDEESVEKPENDEAEVPAEEPEDDKDEEAAEEPEKEPVTELNYTIVKGDTLSKIAAKYGCTVKEIVELNKELIQNPDMIQIGWKLRIPVKGAKPAPEQETPAVPEEDKKYVVYVVKKGDTLWVISQQCGCTVKDIMELNRELINNPDLIHTGWELMVPEK